MRNICEVIDQMVQLIPDREQGLSDALMNVARSASYAPPEVQGYYWKQVTRILQIHFGAPALPEQGTWQWNVLLIFNPELPRDAERRKEALLRSGQRGSASQQ